MNIEETRKNTSENWKRILESQENVEVSERKVEIVEIRTDYKKLKCPRCKETTLVNMSRYWLIPEGSTPTEDDVILKCFNCFIDFTLGYVKLENRLEGENENELPV